MDIHNYYTLKEFLILRLASLFYVSLSRRCCWVAARDVLWFVVVRELLALRVLLHRRFFPPPINTEIRHTYRSFALAGNVVHEMTLLLQSQ
jgi:hypothetical protein